MVSVRTYIGTCTYVCKVRTYKTKQTDQRVKPLFKLVLWLVLVRESLYDSSLVVTLLLHRQAGYCTDFDLLNEYNQKQWLGLPYCRVRASLDADIKFISTTLYQEKNGLSKITKIKDRPVS